MADKDILARMYDEAINGGNLDLIDELLSDDFVEHEEFPGLDDTRDSVKKLFGMAQGAFTNFRMEPTQFVSEGDLVVAWVRMKGTHTGEFMGIPASGNELDLELVDMVRVRDGKIVEHWGVSDSLAMMQQLGAAPQPPSG
jgi:steroid delta-isomerase-like uncharacterized protein